MRTSITTLRKHLPSVLPRHGMTAFLHWLVDRIAKRIMVFDVTHLMILDARPRVLPRAGDAGFTFRFLTPTEIGALARDESNQLDPAWADRASSGSDYCFAALSEGRLAAYGWFALASIEAEQNRGVHPRSGVALSFPDDVAFLYKGMTHPDYRGLGLYGTVIGFALEALSGQGVKRILTTADWTNRAALNSCYRLGFRRLGRVGRWRWGKTILTHTPRAARYLQIRFADEALVQIRPSPTGLGDAHASGSRTKKIYQSDPLRSAQAMG